MSLSYNSGSSQNTTNSQSTGTGSSNSNSVLVNQDPQLDFLRQFGNMAGQLGQQQYGWAQDQFQNNSDLTDKNVNDYLQNSDLAGQAGQRDYANYNDIFNPAAGSLTEDWQSYTSPERVADEMGRSETDVAQNFEGQRKNLEKNLQSFGVNPSDPRYAGAQAASRTAQAAAEAGAGTKARLNTEATGRQLRQSALNEAHLLPGQQATEQNVSMQGNTGAQNAAMGNTATGALTLGTAPTYLNAGVADVKFAPLGTSSSSQNNSQSTGAGQGTSSNSGGSSSGGSGGGNSPNYPSPSRADNSGGRSAQPANNGTSQSSDPANKTLSSQRMPAPDGGGPPDAQVINTPDGGYNPTDGSGRSMNDWQNNSGDPNAGNPGETPNSSGDPYGPATDTGWGSGSDPNAGYDPSTGFAGGGAIPDGMSPSGGQKVDDVPATIPQTGGRAQLNAGEFVMPEDTVQWLGHKFFQDLIVKSRKARQANPGPAHPTMNNGVQHHAFGGGAMPDWAPHSGGWGLMDGYTGGGGGQSAMGGGGQQPPAPANNVGDAMPPGTMIGGHLGAAPNPGVGTPWAPTGDVPTPPVSGEHTPTPPTSGSLAPSSTDVPTPPVSGELRPEGIPEHPPTGTPAPRPNRNMNTGGVQTHSTLPTMRNYQAGNRQQQFRPRQPYFTPRAPFQRQAAPGFTPNRAPAPGAQQSQPQPAPRPASQPGAPAAPVQGSANVGQDWYVQHGMPRGNNSNFNPANDRPYQSTDPSAPGYYHQSINDPTGWVQR